MKFELKVLIGGLFSIAFSAFIVHDKWKSERDYDYSGSM